MIEAPNTLHTCKMKYCITMSISNYSIFNNMCLLHIWRRRTFCENGIKTHEFEINCSSIELYVYIVYFFMSVTFARTVPFLVTIKMTQDSDAAMIPYNHSPDKLQLWNRMNTLKQSWTLAQGLPGFVFAKYRIKNIQQ